MKLIFKIVFLLIVIVVEISTEFTYVSVHRISPKGFRIKAKEHIVDERIAYVVFYVNINRTTTPGPEGPTHFVAVITERIIGYWTYINVNTRVDGGKELSFHIATYTETHKLISSKEYKKEFPDFKIDVLTPIEDRCAALYRVSERCQLSATTVRGLVVCQEKLIFEEHFDTLDPKVWKIDARIPSDAEDSPFLSFQNDPDIVYINDGWLTIKPKFQSRTTGFSESSLKTGTLKIEGCSGTEQECIRNAKYSQILPPIISARIRTKHSFSFRYGKIVIGASMPRGDWVVPMLLLEPLENYYGPSKYASGQIRIASLLGNQVLQTKYGKDISNRHLSAGVVLGDEEPLYDACLRHYDSDKRLPDEFHNYTLTWTEDSITVGIDDHIYGEIEGGFSKLSLYKNSNSWDSDHRMAPFDREFYLTIGLSVGGHTDFPDYCTTGEDSVMKPWMNYDPKAMLNFWKDRQNWMRSWERYDTKFQVNFILVYAL